VTAELAKINTDQQVPADFIAGLAERNQAALKLGALLAAFFVPVFWMLDWLVMPSYVVTTLVLRVGCAFFSLKVYLIVRRYPHWALRHIEFLAMSCFLLPGWAIVVMCWLHQGYESSYYAGLILVFITVGFLFTWPMRVALTFNLLIYIAYMTPMVLGLIEVNNLTTVLSNQFFLVSAIVLTTATQRLRYDLEMREFKSRQRLALTSNELALANVQLKELDKMKNEFFANVSHELRTPLTLILAPVDDLLSRPVEVPHRETLEIVKRNAARLLRLIDDLLDLARLDVGGLRLQVTKVDLAESCSKLWEAFQPTAKTRGITFNLQAPALDVEVYADPHRLEIVMTNLVANALKFTGRGGSVTLAVRIVDSKVRLEVVDTGPGLAEEDQRRVFDRFYQVEGSQTRRYGGAGIGLALAAELVRLHSSQLRVQSKLGEGSTFYFDLPQGQEHFRADVLERRIVYLESHAGRRAEDRGEDSMPIAITEEPPAPYDEPIFLERGRRAKILVAEDNLELRSLIVKVLQASFEVVSVGSGPEAWRVVQEQRPDMVLSDVMMPELSGTELCRLIKADASLSNTPVLLLTARHGTDAAMEGYSSGADDFVTKPFHPRLLAARVHAQLKLRAMSLQLAAQSRLSTAATLAAGVAHEIKNPINAILNSSIILQKGTASKQTSDKLLNVVINGAQRILDILTALEDQVRPADGDMQTLCNVREGLDSAVTLLEHRMTQVTVHRDYQDDSLVLGSPRPLNQVFLNLIDNAVRMGPTQLWISVRKGRQEGMLEIRVADNGPGVSRDMREQIFDPFFTTRDVGEGTGLGLYMARKLVRDSGGEIWVEERQGGGAEFVVILPSRELRRTPPPLLRTSLF